MEYYFDSEIHHRRIQMGVLETAMDKAVRRCSIEVAKWGLRRNMYRDIIAKETNLTLDELDRLERGEDISWDRNEDEDDE